MYVPCPTIARLVEQRRQAYALQWRSWLATVILLAGCSLLALIPGRGNESQVVFMAQRGTTPPIACPIKILLSSPSAKGGAGNYLGHFHPGSSSRVVLSDLTSQPPLPFIGDGSMEYDSDYDFGVPALNVVSQAVQPMPRQPSRCEFSHPCTRRPSVWLPAINISQGGATDPDIQFLQSEVVTGQLLLRADGTVRFEPDSIPATRLLRWLTESVQVQLSRSVCSPALDENGQPITVSVPYQCRFSRTESAHHVYSGDQIKVIQ